MHIPFRERVPQIASDLQAVTTSWSIKYILNIDYPKVSSFQSIQRHKCYKPRKKTFDEAESVVGHSNFAIVLTVKTILLQTQIATPAMNQYSNLFAQSIES